MAAFVAASSLAAFVDERVGDAVLVVAVDGHGASGKSTIAAALARMRDVALVHTDDFFVPARDRAATLSIDGRYDWRRLRAEALEPLRRRRTARFAATRWDRDDHEAVVIEPAQVVILEGVYAAGANLEDLVDHRVLVTTPVVERLSRLHERVPEGQWDDGWIVAELEYFAALDPPRGFDLQLSGSERIHR